MFLHLLARDRQILVFLYGVTLAKTGIWQSPSSEHDIVKLLRLAQVQRTFRLFYSRIWLCKPPQACEPSALHLLAEWLL
jgi:hypothetical protein